MLLGCYKERYLKVTLVLVGFTILYWKYSCKTQALRRSLQPEQLKEKLRRGEFNGNNMYQKLFNNETCVDILPNSSARNTTIIQYGKRVTKIAFLKVHKAGSSTVSNIFLRFGLKHNLTFAIPHEGSFIRYEGEVIPNKYGGLFDIMAVHTVFNKNLYDSLVSKKAVKVAIVREPLQRMISAAYFFRDKKNDEFLKAYRAEMFIENIISKPEIFGRGLYNIVRNAMALDFGFKSAGVARTNQSIQEYLRYLDKQFSIVLVVERFDESLVLMKRMLNWTLRDILYIPLNSYRHELVNVSQEAKDMFRKTSFLDYAVYDFFRRKMESMVCKGGSDFQQEVIHFQRILKDLSHFCGGDKNSSVLKILRSQWNQDFSLSNRDCDLMRTPVLDFLEILKARMMPDM